MTMVTHVLVDGFVANGDLAGAQYYLDGIRTQAYEPRVLNASEARRTDWMDATYLMGSLALQQAADISEKGFSVLKLGFTKNAERYGGSLDQKSLELSGFADDRRGKHCL